MHRGEAYKLSVHNKKIKQYHFRTFSLGFVWNKTAVTE
jgi:hypothetical protein